MNLLSENIVQQQYKSEALKKYISNLLQRVLNNATNSGQSFVQHCGSDHFGELREGGPNTIDELASALACLLENSAKDSLECVPDTTQGRSVASRQTLDLTVVGRLRDALGTEVVDAIRPFVEDMPSYFLNLEEALDIGNIENIKETAYAIKGGAANLGAKHLASIAREIEMHASNGAVEQARNLVTALRTEYALAEPLLTAELGTKPRTKQSHLDMDAPKVLVVDDDRSTRTTVRLVLQRKGFVVEEAVDGFDAISKLAYTLPDAILLDGIMPRMDGFTLCAHLKSHSDWKNIPILMVTALEDRGSIERAFEAGAIDFIAKPIHFSVLGRRLNRIIEANRAHRTSWQLAFIDSLTGLPNRCLFLEKAERAIEHAVAKSSKLAILFLDLDRFKNINDTLGHEAGDTLLSAVGNRLKSCVRVGDCVARLGGDEFAIMLDELPRTEVISAVAKKIFRCLATSIDIKGYQIVTTTSIGISVYPDDGTDVSTLLRRADAAMYRAKRGNQGIAFYEPAIESALTDRLRVENALRKALQEGELLVYYQPIIDAVHGSINGVEALLRWQHPERGMIPPAEFIPIAEETGIIHELGEYVLKEVCNQTRWWLDKGIHVQVAVNISGIQLQNGKLLDIVSKALNDSRLPPELLTLEITESVLMEQSTEPVSVLRQIRELGVCIAIDDFGTGYSSLAYLKRFPIDHLKIDRSFIQDIVEDADTLSIVAGIVSLAHSLRLKVVAEGVETSEQREMLNHLDCDLQQGFLHFHPQPANQISVNLFGVKPPLI